MIIYFIYPLFLILITLVSCNPNSKTSKTQMGAISTNATEFTKADGFDDYWYSGTAELTSYELLQSRYGEAHNGKATLIFVTEKFLPDKQVKDETGRYPSSTILKLNFMKKFLTGIYPYSMMLSTFTPVNAVEGANTLKITASSQEWCGHTFSQYNLRNDKYNVVNYSYFEKEGDTKKSLPKALTEDEIWTRIRLNPEYLPKGDIKLIQSLFYNRLKHNADDVYDATASLNKDKFNGKPVMNYTIRYKHNERRLSIFFQENFPFIIEGWEESYFGMSDKSLFTTAKRISTIREKYWSKNNKQDTVLRQALGLPIY